MATVTTLDLKSMRRVWRAISAEDRRSHPTLRSRVSLDENGPLLAISEQGGRFRLSVGGVPLLFERLEDAELAAVGVLAEREGVPQ
jgi:hypothetical protein